MLPRVFGLCNPLLDISAEVKPELLQKYGLEPSNTILAAPMHLPLYEELIKNHTVTYVPGGSGCNSMRFGQWLSTEPETFAYAGAIGDDSYGKILKDELNKDAVLANLFVSTDQTTGTCATLITNKQRSLVAHLGAAEHFSINHLKSDLSTKIIAQASIFYVTSFFLTHSLDSAIYLAEIATREDKTFIMNLSAPFLMLNPMFYERIRTLLPYADFVFSNHHEARALSLAEKWETNDIKIIAQKCAMMEKKNKTRDRIVIFTCGPNPAIVYYQGKVTEYPVIPITPDKFVDENGAGDAYLGAVAGLAAGKSLDESIHLGGYAAYMVLQEHGAAIPKTMTYVKHGVYEFGTK